MGVLNQFGCPSPVLADFLLDSGTARTQGIEPTVKSVTPFAKGKGGATFATQLT
jgi:hypothetical protein